MKIFIQKTLIILGVVATGLASSMVSTIDVPKSEYNQNEKSTIKVEKTTDIIEDMKDSTTEEIEEKNNKVETKEKVTTVEKTVEKTTEKRTAAKQKAAVKKENTKKRNKVATANKIKKVVEKTTEETTEEAEEEEYEYFIFEGVKYSTETIPKDLYDTLKSDPEWYLRDSWNLEDEYDENGELIPQIGGYGDAINPPKDK